MIFGEDFGQLAASGEYEEYKSGTTMAQLNAAIDALTIEEYFDSFLTVADNSYFATEGTILYPFNTTTKIYLSNTLHDNETNRTSITTYYYSGTILEIDKKISGSSVARTVKRTNDGTISISHWTLYRRQKSYDVAISGSKVASAIAPVQDSLATANKNYAVGEQFYYDGHLYKVTSAITSGAQIVLGTNAVLADDVVTQINGIKSGNANITIPTTHKAATSVSFDKPFSTVPNVVVSANKTGYGNGCFVNVGNITTSGFNIYAEDDSNTSAYTLNVCWIATV